MSEFKITNKVRELRFMENEMTQQELADKVSVTRQTIASIEKNKYSPSLGLAFKISKELKKEIGDVFYYK